MRLQLPQQIDKKQWLTRLGINGEMPGGLEVQLEAAEKKLLGTAMPQGVYRVFETEKAPDGCDSKLEGVLKSGVIDLPGSAIKKHLAECNGMIIMAVTLGAAVDRLIRMSQVRDMAEAVLLDSGASVLAEQCADILEEIIQSENSELAADGRGASAGSGAAGNAALDAVRASDRKAPQTYFTGRYSPGYGDFPVEMQDQLIKALDGPRTIGLTTNESHILIPRKSITAIIGTADHPVTGYLATCNECAIRECCRLRAEGTPCYKQKRAAGSGRKENSAGFK